MPLPYEDRHEAGRVLAEALRRRLDDRLARAVILGLPRGGVPVAFEVASAFERPLDVCVVRKLGVPGHDELALGAIATGGLRIVNESLVRGLGITPDQIERVTQREETELRRRESLYREGRTRVDVRGRVVVLVDDGLATGATMIAAVRAIRRADPSAVIVAVPVASPEACDDLRGEADEVICVETPAAFRAVGAWYEDFRPTTDDEVRELLRRATVAARAGGGS